MAAVDHRATVANRKIGVIPNFLWHSWECLDTADGSVLMTGCVSSGLVTKGPRKGRPRYDGEPKRVVVTDGELLTEKARYECEEGKCSECGGDGQEFAGWNHITGTRWRECTRCGAPDNPEAEFAWILSHAQGRKTLYARKVFDDGSIPRGPRGRIPTAERRRFRYARRTACCLRCDSWNYRRGITGLVHPADRTERPTRIWVTYCPFKKSGFPSIGTFGKSIAPVVSMRLETWQRLCREIPELATHQFEVGSQMEIDSCLLITKSESGRPPPAPPGWSWMQTLRRSARSSSWPGKWTRTGTVCEKRKIGSGGTLLALSRRLYREADELLTSNCGDAGGSLNGPSRLGASQTTDTGGESVVAQSAARAPREPLEPEPSIAAHVRSLARVITNARLHVRMGG
jgi:hypothetical protein